MPEEQILFPPPNSDWQEVKRQLLQTGCSLLNTYEYDNESFSVWDLPCGQGELDFVVDLTVDLGYFVVRGMPDKIRDELSDSIGLMSNAQIEQLFQDTDPLRRRQAIRMASLLGEDSFVDAVMRLCHDLDPQVAHEAKIFCSETLGQSVNDTDDAVQLFESTPDPRDRRQILRWLLQDFSQCNAGIEAVVISALADVDWEVRVTAIIAAARYKLKTQAKKIAECSLEPGPGQKIRKRDKEIIHGIRQVALLLLSGQEIEQPSSDNLKHARWWRLYRAVVGANNGVLDTIQVAVDYFAKPHPAGIGMPVDVPGLKYTNQQIYLANTNIELQWVPALPHIR